MALRKILSFVCIVLLIVMLSACGSDKNKLRSLHASLSTGQTQVKVDETVILTATFSNTGSTVTLKGGASLFTFEARDKAGQVYEEYSATGSNRKFKLNKNGLYSENHSIKFDKPGTYSVLASASFGISHQDFAFLGFGDVLQGYGVETNKITIEVK